MILGHRIRLDPTPAQVDYFIRACGVARFSYNWALAEWRREYAMGGKPTEAMLRRRLNSRKSSAFPWMADVTKSAPQHAVKNLGRAYRSFFEDMQSYKQGRLPWRRIRTPRFKKKGCDERFRADNGPRTARCSAVLTADKSVKIPRIGWVRMREVVRFAGRILSVIISQQAGWWYASFNIEVEHRVPIRQDNSVIGVDLGINSLATLSDGTVVKAPKPLKRFLSKIRRLSRSVARKSRGSRNRVKAKIKLARLYSHVRNVRADALHKLTTGLTRYATIVIEDLNVTGMLRNGRLSRAVSDLGLYEFRRQLIYKAAMKGSRVKVMDRWFPSTKLCSSCSTKNSEVVLGVSNWQCGACGSWHERDLNAAINLEIAGSPSVTACGADGSGVGDEARTKPTALNQEVVLCARLSRTGSRTVKGSQV